MTARRCLLRRLKCRHLLPPPPPARTVRPKRPSGGAVTARMTSSVAGNAPPAAVIRLVVGVVVAQGAGKAELAAAVSAPYADDPLRWRDDARRDRGVTRSVISVIRSGKGSARNAIRSVEDHVAGAEMIPGKRKGKGRERDPEIARQTVPRPVPVRGHPKPTMPTMRTMKQ